MVNYKAGKYELHQQPDLFNQESGELILGKNIMVHLSKKEATTLFKDGLYSKLGFTGWIWIEE